MELMGFCQKNQPICPGQNFQITAKNSVPLAGLVQKTAGFQLFSLLPSTGFQKFRLVPANKSVTPPEARHHSHPMATAEMWQRARTLMSTPLPCVLEQNYAFICVGPFPTLTLTFPSNHK